MTAAERAEERGRPAMLVRFVVAGLGYAAVAATFTSHSIPALIAVLLPGALVVPLAYRTARTTPTGRLRRTHLPWLVWAVVFGAWEVAVLLVDGLSFSLMMDPVLEIYPIRLAAWAAWLYAGWLLVRRWD